MTRIVDTIYMVDDSDDEAFVTTELFRRQGVEADLRHRFAFRSLAELADDGEAFDPISSIVVVDLNLRTKRGTDVLREMRAAPGGDDLIVGICTGSQDPADGIDALEAGGDFCIAKPLDRESLEKLCLADDRLRMINEADAPLIIERTDVDAV